MPAATPDVSFYTLGLVFEWLFVRLMCSPPPGMFVEQLYFCNAWVVFLRLFLQREEDNGVYFYFLGCLRQM